MKITPETNVKEIIKINEKMLDAFIWLAPEFNQLRSPTILEQMGAKITVSQAARIAKIPITEALYVLNLTAGEAEEDISKELLRRVQEDFENPETEEILKPAELLGVFDNDLNVHVVDVEEEDVSSEDPMSKIINGLNLLRSPHDILLVRHPFDPDPLRNLLARKFGLTS